MSDANLADVALVGTSVPPPGHAATPRPLSRRGPRDRSRLLAGTAALAVLAGLAFLLLGSPSTQLNDPVAQAATLSSSVPGFRMRMSMEMTSPTLSAPITASGRGTVDLRDHASSMSLALDMGSDPQVTQALGGSTMRMEMIMDGAVLYMKLPSAATAVLPPYGKPWLKLDLGKLAGLPGLSSLGSNPTTSDPSHILQYLRSASGSVLAQGQQRVDGFQTTHYRASLSLDQLIAALPSAERSQLQRALSSSQQTIPIDVWIDSRHFVRRVAMTIEMTLPNGSLMQETTTVDLSDYGPQARPATPPPSEVQDMSRLAGGLGG